MKPNVGMLYPMAAEVDEYVKGTSISYKTPFVVSEARGATLTWESSDGEFYGDNVLLDSDKGIVGYTLDFEPAGIKSPVRATMLGETVLEDDKGYRVTGKNPPDLGFSYIKEMREEDDETGVVTTTYEGWFFYRVKFRINSEEARTKEKNLEWRVPTMNGTGAGVLLDDGGEPIFAEHQDFESITDAQEWIASMYGAEEQAETPAQTPAQNTTPSSP